MIALVLSLLAGHPAVAAPPPRPRLVVVITVDQLAQSYIDKMRGQLTGGLGRLLKEGAVFTRAYQDHAITETAPGHSTVLSGRWPRNTGILTNLLGVGDSSAALVEANGPGASPRRFRGTALFDWMAAADSGARALSVSRKDRSAILPIGRARQHVYWYQSGKFVTSRYYADSLPVWVRVFNDQRVPFKSASREWTLLLPDSAYPEADSAAWENAGRDGVFPHRLPADSVRATAAYTATPFLDSLTLAFALQGVEQLRLGRRGPTDLLAIGLSSTDAVGHIFGPDSREVRDQILRLDRYLAAFFERLADRVGRNDYIVVLTADHGITPFPAASRARGATDAYDVRLDTLIHAVNQELSEAVRSMHGPEEWLEFDEGIIWLRDNGRLSAFGLKLDSVWTALSARLLKVPGVARVDRPASLARADTADDAVARRWVHHIPPDAPIPLVVTLSGLSDYAPRSFASHGKPSDADAHVALVFWGSGFVPGTFDRRVATVDIAPTLARRLGVAPRSVLDGRVLTEILSER